MSTATTPGKTARAALPFFELGGQYQIAADSAPDRLFDDGSCLLSTAIGVLEEMPERDKQPPIYWAALYLLKMAKAAYDASAPYPDGGAGAGGAE